MELNDNATGFREGEWKIFAHADATHRRKVMAVKHGHSVRGVERPRTDRDDFLSTLLGCIHRVSPDMPIITKTMEKNLEAFCDHIFPIFFDPLDWEELMLFEEYCDHLLPTKGAAFVEEFRQHHYNRICDFFDFSQRGRKLSSFIKDEGYDKFKQSRTIQGNSREMLEGDTGSYFSRVIKSIEKQVYHKMTGTVKGLTPHERADLLYNMDDYFTKWADDYSSYEASFSIEKLEAVEFRFYSYMLQRFPPIVSEAIFKLIGGKNIMVFKNLRFMVFARRMSGDADTALGNVVDNWVSTMLLLYMKGVSPERAVEMMYLEGDDKTLVTDGVIVTAEEATRFSKENGMKSKTQDGLDHEFNDFCQCCTSVKYVKEENNRVLLGGILKNLASFSNINVKYKDASEKVLNSLLRAKAMSLLYLYRGCPVLHALAVRILYLTRSVNVRDKHWKEVLSYNIDFVDLRSFKFREFLKMEIHLEDRAAVENVQGISVSMQLHMEEIINKWEGGPLSIPVEYFDTYTPNQKLPTAEQDTWSIFSDVYVSDRQDQEWEEPDTIKRQQLRYLAGFVHLF
jgi:hypothetical protein